MAPVKDTFRYAARFDSVGLFCGDCIHAVLPQSWPDVDRTFSCGLHGVLLAAELAPTGYMEGEWFCRDFVNNGMAFPPAVEHFEAIKADVPAGVLFGFYGSDGNLKEVPLGDLPRKR